MKLYEISDKIEMILNDGVDMETGEITADAVMALDALEERKEEVALWIGKYAKGLLAEAAAIYFEIEALRVRAKRHENYAARLTTYLAMHVPDEGYKDAQCVIKWSKSVAVGELEPGSLQHIDPTYIKVKEVTTRSLDKALALKDLKAEKKIEGLYLDQRKKLKIS